MTWTIDASELEGAIVRHCSPTLAGLKPASLFTFPGTFVENDLDDASSAEQHRQALIAATAFCRRQIADAGLEIRVLAWKRCGALVYVYRPQLLEAALAEPAAVRVLDRTGYRTGDTEACLQLLGERLDEPQHVAAEAAGASVSPAASARKAKPCPCEQRACASEFPHEIGFFLGYPAADVIGFIENRGKNSIACGPWKVYVNKDEALRTFERYRGCTRAYARAYRHGSRLSRLAVAPR